jgi:hypothetical protein
MVFPKCQGVKAHVLPNCTSNCLFVRLSLPSTPTAKREQHLQQVGVVDAPVAVDIHPAKTRARLSEGEQHRQQVSVIDATVAVNIAVVRRAGRRVQ